MNNVTLLSCGLFPTKIQVGGTASSENSQRMKLRTSYSLTAFPSHLPTRMLIPEFRFTSRAMIFSLMSQ